MISTIGHRSIQKSDTFLTMIIDNLPHFQDLLCPKEWTAPLSEEQIQRLKRVSLPDFLQFKQRKIIEIGDFDDLEVEQLMYVNVQKFRLTRIE